MASPTLAFLAPPNIDGYDRRQEPSAQPSSVPKTFVDAMRVRQSVFVEEQHVPLDSELDEDDPRSCHWVAYQAGDSAPQPVGTIRLVPYPHTQPHPQPGGVYAIVDGEVALLEIRPEGITSASGGGGSSTPVHGGDGQEPYVKLGRLAVLGSLRGQRIGQLLVQTVLEWMRTHPDYFDSQDAPPEAKFRGLVLIHAQVTAAAFWKKLGFTVDETMGKWWEEGIPHVGMFLRLENPSA